MKFGDLLEESSNVSNVTLACGDGHLASHKIVVAGVSSFIKNILADIPVGDDVTIILPDFTTTQVELLFKYSMEKKTHLNLRANLRANLLAAFGVTSVPLHTEQCNDEEVLHENVELKKELEVDDEDEDEDENDFTKYMDNEAFFSDVIKLNGKKLEEKTDEEQKIDLDCEREGEDGEDFPDNSDFRPNTAKGKKPKVDYAALAANCDVDIDANINILEKDLITNPTNKDEERINESTRMKIKLQKAMGDVFSGQCNSVREAARKYGVSQTTLGRMCSSGGKYEYTGRGRWSKVFTREEEKHITKRVLELTDGGENLTPMKLKQIVDDEMTLMRVNFPDLVTPTRKMLDAFARRNGLDLFIKATHMNKIRNYDCDLCGKSYTLKNHLAYHRKKMHFL